MTTKLTISNQPTSNGDVVVRAIGASTEGGGFGNHDFTLLPGESHELWITTTSALFVTETWPSKTPAATADTESDAA